jgi:hypothetical protein
LVISENVDGKATVKDRYRYVTTPTLILVPALF